MQCYFGFAAAVASTIGEGIADEGIIDEETIDEGVGYEEINFLDGHFSNQETKKFAGLIFVSKVTNI